MTAKTTLESLSKLSFRNEDKMEEVNWCYHCCKKVLKKDIKEYVDAPPNRTTICPHCGIDAVIPGDYSNQFEVIKALYNDWFK